MSYSIGSDYGHGAELVLRLDTFMDHYFFMNILYSQYFIMNNILCSGGSLEFALSCT